MRENPERDASILKAYIDGEPFKEIVDRFGVTNSWVMVLARRSGAPPRKRGSRFKELTSDARKKVIGAWNGGIPAQVIGRDVGLHVGLVHRVLREAGIDYEPRRHGDKTGRWHRGEWRREDHGYVAVKLLESDPLFCMTGKDGYVLEHRYLMAKKLKRALTPNETVHHKDGDKKHNKLRNLQLRQGKHGKNECFECADCGSRNVKAVSI